MSHHWRTIPGFVQVGSTGKVRGRNGELRIYIDDHFLDTVLGLDFIFIEAHGNKVPLAVESFREINDLLVKFEGIDDPGAAARWASSPVFVPSDEVQFKASKDKSFLQYGGLKGYHIVDKHLGNIGTIEEVREFPQQEMAILHYREKEILIPLNTAFILDTDDASRTVYMDLPEGLLEVS